MGGHGDDAFVFKINLIEFGDSKGIVLLDGMRQCVDNGIACDENAAVIKADDVVLKVKNDGQTFLDRRKPGQSKYTTKRNESDTVEILSGVFEGRTTGTPISLMVRNQDQRSRDYGDIAVSYRPGHADFCFREKYGFRDYRGGGRSSGRETIGRVAAGAIASKLLGELGIVLTTYAKSIGPVTVDEADYDFTEITNNSFYLPNKDAAKKAAEYVSTLMPFADGTL